MDTAAMALGIGLGGNLGARLIGSNVGGAYMSNTLTPELLKRLMMQTGGLLGGTATRPTLTKSPQLFQQYSLDPL